MGVSKGLSIVGLLFSVVSLAWIAALGPAHAARADEPTETPGVARLPAEPGAHWVWVPDRLLQHSILFDGDTGVMLGAIDSAATLTPKAPVLARGHFYSVDLAYSRGLRGDRIDFVSIYDAVTLGYTSEIMLPTRQGQSNASLQYAELLGDRFLAVFNQFPNISVSIVDLEKNEFVQEINIAGCAAIYPVDRRHFATLCGDGTATLVALDPTGHQAGLVASEPFFDPVKDPVFIAAGRNGTAWTFVTFKGQARTVDFAGGKPRVGAEWSLLDEMDRRENWLPGGLQHVALHAPTNRLFVIMHEGGPGSHKEAGSEIWVFDVNERKRIARFPAPNVTGAFLAAMANVERGGWIDSAMQWGIPSQGVQVIVVSQDDHPVLFARHSEVGAVAVMDANTGETLRMLDEAGLTGPTMRVP